MMGSAAAPSIAARLLKVLDIESSPCAMAGYGPPCQQPRQPRSARFFAKICHYGTGQAGWRTLVWLDMSDLRVLPAPWRVTGRPASSPANHGAPDSSRRFVIMAQAKRDVVLWFGSICQI